MWSHFCVSCRVDFRPSLDSTYLSVQYKIKSFKACFYTAPDVNMLITIHHYCPSVTSLDYFGFLSSKHICSNFPISFFLSDEFRSFALTHPEYAKLFTTYIELQRYQGLQGGEPDCDASFSYFCSASHDDNQEDSTSDKKDDWHSWRSMQLWGSYVAMPFEHLP